MREKRLFKKGDKVKLKTRTLNGYKGKATVIEDQISEDSGVVIWRDDFPPPIDIYDSSGEIFTTHEHLSLCRNQ